MKTQVVYIRNSMKSFGGVTKYDESCVIGLLSNTDKDCIAIFATVIPADMLLLDVALHLHCTIFSVEMVIKTVTKVPVL